MSLPLLTEHFARSRLSAYCARKVLGEVCAGLRLKLEFVGDHVTLVEVRLYFCDPRKWLPVTHFRVNADSGILKLYRPNFIRKSIRYPWPAQPSRDLDRPIVPLDTVASGAFCG